MMRLLAIGAVVFALMLGVTAAEAQTPDLAFSTYGSGVHAGDKVEALDRQVSCGSTVADGSGDWILRFATDAPCKPVAGDTIAFALNGKTMSATEVFQPGGVPRDVSVGVQLGEGLGLGLLLAVVVVLVVFGIVGLVGMRRSTTSP